MSGWFLVWRGWAQSPDFKPEPFTEREAFLWSIEQAAFEAHVQWFNGAQFQVGRGEFVTSSRKLAAALGWGDKKARLFMARMGRCGKWALRPAQDGAHAPTILTVCNYERFQAPEKAKGAANDASEDAAGAQSGRSKGAQQNEGINNFNEGERIEASASRSLALPLPYDTAIAAWSQIAAIKGWSPVRPTQPLSDKRRRGLGKILKVHGLEGWIAALQRAADSPLLGGPDPPGWFNFEFAITPDKFTKLHEGNYDRTFSNHRSSGQQQSPWLAARDQLLQPDRVSGAAGH